MARWTPRTTGTRSPAREATELGIDVHARFGYTAAPGSTDDARVRHLTLALPPRHTARLFQADLASRLQPARLALADHDLLWQPLATR
ncbi:hypothetical protein [Streptomyces sp. NPDC002545]